MLSELLESLFVAAMLFISILFVGFLNLAWSWAQEHPKNLSLRSVFAAASIEWGAFLSVMLSHFYRLKAFYEAPPIKDLAAQPRQIPVIFIPSLNTKASLFLFLFWRLKARFWNSLWPFNWKSFLEDPELLADQLSSFIEQVLLTTGSQSFRVISFGSSRPLIGKVLQQEHFLNRCDRWIALSAPQKLSRVYKFLGSVRVQRVYNDIRYEEQRKPDVLIVGQNDLFCYPEDVWGNQPSIKLDSMGHFGVSLHSTTTQSILSELAR